MVDGGAAVRWPTEDVGGAADASGRAADARVRHRARLHEVAPAAPAAARSGGGCRNVRMAALDGRPGDPAGQNLMRHRSAPDRSSCSQSAGARVNRDEPALGRRAPSRTFAAGTAAARRGDATDRDRRRREHRARRRTTAARDGRRAASLNRRSRCPSNARGAEAASARCGHRRARDRAKLVERRSAAASSVLNPFATGGERTLLCAAATAARATRPSASCPSSSVSTTALDSA